MLKKYIALLFVLLTCSIYAQTMYVVGQIDGSWGPTHQMSTQTVNGVAFYNVTIQATGTYNPAAFLFEADGYYNKWNNISANKNTVNTFVWNANYGGTDNSISNGVVSGRYYTFRLKNNGYSSAPGIVMETVASPITIDSVYAFPSSVTANTAVTCSVKVSAQPAADSLYLVYSTDNFATASVVKVTNVDGTTHIGTAQIPGQSTNGLTVKFYALTSTVASSTWGTNRDLCAINYKENGSVYYAYNIAPISTVADGNWSNASIWSTGVIPTGGANVTIANNVTLDTSVTLLSVTVNSGKTLTLSGATAKTLTIATGGTITNNGTIAHGSGTVAFSGAGSVTGTVGFYNVTISGGVNFGTASTINGTLKINGGGYINTNPPIYATGSTLQYNSGGASAYGRYLEWSATTGAGYPANVQISNNTTVVLGTNSEQAVARQISGNLIVDSGSKLSLDSTGYDMTAALTILGDVTINGTLVLSNSAGGDIKTYGNISFGASSVFTPNARAIFFLKDGTQTVTHASGTITIPYLVIGRSGGSGTTAQLNGTHLISSAPNGGNSVSFSNSTDVLDLNGKNIILGTAGQTSTISGSGTFKGNSASSLTSYGTGAGGTISFTTGSQVLSKLILNRTSSGSVILGSNLTINDTLQLASGTLNLNGKTVTLGSSGVLAETAGNTLTGTSGSITTTRTLNAGDLTAGVNIAGLGAKITTTAALGSTVISRGTAAQSVNGTNSVKRFFDITPTNNASLNATLEFAYDTTNELNGIIKSNLRLYKSTNTGTSWTLMGATTNDTTGFKVTLSGIQSFSRWTLADVNGAITSIAAGSWSNPSTWSSNSVPSGEVSVVVNTSVTVDTSITVKNLTINSGKTLTGSDGSARVLTIFSGGSITNNGTFTASDGTVAFSGAGSITGTTALNNVTINGGTDFGTASTVNGTLLMNVHSYINGNPPAYGASSTLQYNTGSTYGRWLEWSDTTGKGYPANVRISNTTTVDLGNSGTGTVRRISGNLTIDASSTFSMNVNKMTAALTVGGGVINNGTVTLSDSVGGDLIVKGNFTNNGTLNHNSRTVKFNGTSSQQIDGTTSPITFGYLTISNSSGVTLAQNVKVKNTATLTSGKVALGNYDFILDTTATIGGSPSASSMLVTNGTGQVKKIFKAVGAFTFPVGDNTGTAEYSPVTFTINSGTFTQDTVGVIVTNAVHPNVTATTDSLKRYWAITSNGITSPSYTAQFSYTSADVAGREYKLFGQKWDGSTWTNTGAVDTTNNRFTVTGITSLGSFTAADSVMGGAIIVNLKVIPQGYYNAGDYLNATDTIQVLLADVNSPYAYIDSVSVILDSLTFTATATFTTTSSGSYYVVVKQRCSVETWSAASVSLTKGVTTSYDFTDAQTKAYGDNLVQVSSSPARYAMYGGDVNQDGYVDPLDMSAIDLDSFNYASGAGLITDVNGDHFVDPLDMSIADQNSFNYVGIKRPVSAKSIKTHSRAPQGIHYQDLKKIVK